MRIYWDPNSILLAEGEDRWRLFHVNYRRNVMVGADVLSLVGQLAGAGSAGIAVEDLKGACARQKLKALDVTSFPLIEHAFANSAMFDREAAAGQILEVTTEEFIDLMSECGFFASSWPITRDHEKKGFTDRFKGNFYQQIGTECVFERLDPTEWWVNQKFTPDRKATRKTPYHYIQDLFLDGYLRKNFTGRNVIEIGCGTGYYTNRIAEYAASAVGLDYNAGYIETAKTVWDAPHSKRAEYSVCNIIDMQTDRPDLLQRRYDAVLLIDTFLFLFDPIYQPKLYEARVSILRNLASLLGPNGQIVIMDPHPLWLSPMLGDAGRPFAVLDCYRNRHFKVIPTLEEVTGLFNEADLRIARILEPQIDDGYRDLDLKGFNFYKEFPAWWVFELEPAAARVRGLEKSGQV